MKFRIYYADESTWTGTLEDNPPDNGVVVIVQEDSMHGRKLVSGGDHYVYEQEDDFGWLACDIESVHWYRERDYPPDLVGIMVSTPKWQRIMKAARNDPEFKKQTALHLYESREAWEKPV